MDRDEFMDIVYSELESDPDNNRANRIIWAADGYAERRVDDALQVIEEPQFVQLGTDCISRRRAIDAVVDELDVMDAPQWAYDSLEGRLKQLPPVTPKQRTEWCPHCGAKMGGERMSIRNEQCRKACRILDDVLANRPTERDVLCVAVDKAFEALKQSVQQRTGKWLMNDHIGTFKIFTCDKCGWNSEAPFNFCPNCGLPMKGDVE